MALSCGIIVQHVELNYLCITFQWQILKGKKKNSLCKLSVWYLEKDGYKEAGVDPGTYDRGGAK